MLPTKPPSASVSLPARPAVSLPPKPAVTVTPPSVVGGVKVENAPETVVEMVPTAELAMIYGESRTRKTTQLAEIAEWLWDEWGLTTRLVTAEEGAGIDPIKPLIDAGVIEYIPLNETVADPISLIRALSKGAWYPLVSTPKGQRLTPKERNGLMDGKVGAYFFEGATTISDRILRHLGQSQRKLQEQVAAAFTVESMIEGEEPEKFGSPGQSHYGFVQTLVMGLFPTTAMLPVRMVVWTAHEGKGDDPNAKGTPVFGPGLAGKAATSKVPALVGDLFHCQTFVDSKTETVKAWIRKHPDDNLSTVLWPAGPRTSPKIAKGLLAKWPEGAIDLNHQSVVDYFKLKLQLKTEETEKLRRAKRESNAQLQSEGS
jgi:hypothetical protein